MDISWVVSAKQRVFSGMDNFVAKLDCDSKCSQLATMTEQLRGLSVGRDLITASPTFAAPASAVRGGINRIVIARRLVSSGQNSFVAKSDHDIAGSQMATNTERLG